MSKHCLGDRQAGAVPDRSDEGSTANALAGDGSYPPAMAERLERALAEPHACYRAEISPAARGWTKPDFPVSDEAAAKRG